MFAFPYWCAVIRIEAKSEQLEMYMQLDVATDVYPMHVGDKFTMVLAPTLNLDGTPDTGFYTQVTWPNSSYKLIMKYFGNWMMWMRLIMCDSCLNVVIASHGLAFMEDACLGTDTQEAHVISFLLSGW